MTWLLGGGGDAEGAAPTSVVPPSPSPIGGTELLHRNETDTLKGEAKR
jgi:hypothetical protein